MKVVKAAEAQTLSSDAAANIMQQPVWAEPGGEQRGVYPLPEESHADLYPEMEERGVNVSLFEMRKPGAFRGTIRFGHALVAWRQVA